MISLSSLNTSKCNNIKVAFCIKGSDKWIIDTKENILDPEYTLRTFKLKRGKWTCHSYYAERNTYLLAYSEFATDKTIIKRRKYKAKSSSVGLLNIHVVDTLRHDIEADCFSLSKDLTHYINQYNHTSFWQCLSRNESVTWYLYTSIDHVTKKIIAFALIPKRIIKQLKKE